MASDVLRIVLTLVERGLPIAQDVADGVAALLATTGRRAPTPDEEAAINTALVQAHTALQNDQPAPQPEDPAPEANPQPEPTPNP